MSFFRNIFYCHYEEDDDEKIIKMVDDIKKDIRDLYNKVQYLDRENTSFHSDLRRLSDKLDNKFDTLMNKIDLLVINLNNNKTKS